GGGGGGEDGGGAGGGRPRVRGRLAPPVEVSAAAQPVADGLWKESPCFAQRRCFPDRGGFGVKKNDSIALGGLDRHPGKGRRRLRQGGTVRRSDGGARSGGGAPGYGRFPLPPRGQPTCPQGQRHANRPARVRSQ